MVFCLFLQSPQLNRAHSGMDGKISLPCTSYETKLSLTIKIDDIISGKRDMDLPGWLWVVQRRMG